MSSSHSPRQADGMTQDEFVEAVVNRLLPVIYAALTVELGRMTRTCMNCEHWLIGSGICGKYQQLPPPHIIANGCDAHERKAPF